MGQQETPGETAEAKTATGAVNSQWPGSRSLGPHHLHLRRHHGWQIERVFQQITEVFHLNRLIATTPEGTLFQLSFCLLLYNMIQVVRGYVAVGQGFSLEVISTELLFVDVSKQLVTLHELVAVGRIVELVPATCSAAVVGRRLRGLLEGLWSDSWIKAPKKTRKPSASKQGKREHTSVYRLLKAHHQSGTNGTVT